MFSRLTNANFSDVQHLSRSEDENHSVKSEIMVYNWLNFSNIGFVLKVMKFVLQLPNQPSHATQTFWKKNCLKPKK